MDGGVEKKDYLNALEGQGDLDLNGGGDGGGIARGKGRTTTAKITKLLLRKGGGGNFIIERMAC